MLIHLFSALPAVAGAAHDAPVWVHIVPAGLFTTVDGRGPYVLHSAQAVMDASMSGGPIPVDENHATDYAMTTGQPSPARGWITEMQARADGIWARIEWTPSGIVLMSEGAYRGISPVLAIDKDDKKTVRRILRAALTNTPNLPALAMLHSEGSGMDFKAQLRTTLGLTAEADEAAILARVIAGHEEITKHAAQIAKLAEAAGSTEKTADGLLVVLNTQRAAATDSAKLATTVVELQTQLSTLQTERGRERAVAVVDGAIKGGKPIAALRDHLISRHMADPNAVETELAALPSLHGGGIDGQHLAALQSAGGGDGDRDWTPTEKMTCEKMGVSKDQWKAHQKKKAEAARSAA